MHALGDAARIRGLRRSPELNGECGVVMGTGPRVSVWLPAGRVVRADASCVDTLERLTVGTEAVLCGLSRTTTLNGARGVVTSVDGTHATVRLLGGREVRACAAYVRNCTARNVDLKYQLGMAYFRGTGLDADETQSEIYLAMAAECGHASALYMRGVLYCSGRGVVADEARGAQYVRRAAALGHEGALDLLECRVRSSNEAPEEPHDAEFCGGDVEFDFDDEYDPDLYVGPGGWPGDYAPAATRCDYATQRQIEIDELKRKRQFDLYGI
jgi:hypothetical protein